jgi:hypothetical protein
VEKFAIVVVLWIFGALMFFVNTGAFPQTGIGWLMFVVIGPPLYLAMEVLGEALFHGLRALPGIRTLHARVESAAAGKRFSWTRVGYGVLSALVLVAAVITSI